MRAITCLAIAGGLMLAQSALALDRPDVTFKIFQFPPDKIPRIDAKADDWDIVPDSYAIGLDQCVNDSNANQRPDPKNMDVKVKVGWVKGENRLYFLYQATDDHCDFAQPGLHNDIFEVIVDGDKSGGNLIARNPDKSVDWANWLTVQSVHAQNYHIFMPAVDKDWCMMWGPQAQWIKQMPWSNYACTCTAAKPMDAGKVTGEFWLTPFDHADASGPGKSTPSKLVEGETIGLSWAVMDYDDATNDRHAFWNLSRTHTAYGDASHLCEFKLMPLEPQFLPKQEARWTFTVTDEKARTVTFKDQSLGKITAWKWDFGDGATSTDQNPTHTYKAPNNYIVTLEVTGDQGTSRLAKVWDVSVK